MTIATILKKYKGWTLTPKRIETLEKELEEYLEDFDYVQLLSPY